MKEAIKYLSPHDFTQWACEQVRDGYGFVPLVGSGISTKSGILMGVEFTDYLTWTVYRCVASSGKDQPGHRLDLRQDGWPQQPRPAEMRKVKEWVWRLFDEACRRCGLEPSPAKESDFCVKSVAVVNGSTTGVPFEAALRRPLVPAALRCPETAVDDKPIKTFFRTLQHEEYLKTFRGDPETSPTSTRYIEESAIRALHDWRSTLEFLSRLRSHKDGHLYLDDVADQAVIDSFNLHITRGRRANLAHGMLCHLATRARIRTILTTNFDTLLEDAFAQTGEPCAVFPVSVNGELPPPDSVHAQNCIVKLHGGVAETRANHSLDEPPSDDDKKKFFHYIRGRYPDENKYEGGFLASNLLVCGYSGTDMRCVHMIKYVLDSDPEAQVFWICHSDRDLESLHSLFVDDGYGIASSLKMLHDQAASGKIKARLIVTVSARTDLLLYEFYQRLALTLPRGGFNFPLSYNVPPEKSFSAEVDEEPLSDFAKDIIDRVNERRGKPELIVADGSSGLTSPLRQAFNELTRRCKLRGIWMELDYYSDHWALAHGIFEQIALQLGRFQLDHARFVPRIRERRKETRRKSKCKNDAAEGEDRVYSKVEEWMEYIRQLLRCWNIEPSDWLIVLNARNGPGGASSWGQKYWDQEAYDGAAALVEALISVTRPHGGDGVCANGNSHLQIRNSDARSVRSQGFNVIYAPYSEARHQRDVQKEQWVTMRVQKLTQRGTPNRKHQEVTTSLRYIVKGSEGIKVDGNILKKLAKRIHSISVEGPEQTFEERIDDVVDVWLDSDCHSRELNVMRQRRFLYGVTLFRNARHLASFTSDAVYPAPYEFSIAPIGAPDQEGGVINVGMDNEWIRSADVNGWLKKLNSFHQILLCTPGAHAWMYRDARLAIQYIAEQTSPWDLEKTNASGPEHLAFTSALATRARTHLRIATWYLRAFCATGHAVAMLEGLYHLAECITFAPVAEISKADTIPPDSKYVEQQIRYQRRLAKHALFEMVKGLRLGRGAIEFWMQPTAGHAWFGRRAVKRLEGLLRPALKKIWPKQEEGAFSWEYWLDVLCREMMTLPSLDGEVALSNRSDLNCQDELHHPASRSNEGFDYSPRISARQIESFDLERDLHRLLEEVVELPASMGVESYPLISLLSACETSPQKLTIESEIAETNYLGTERILIEP